MEATGGMVMFDLAAAAAAGGSGAILSQETSDLDVNLVRFVAGAGVAAHVNSEVDVLIVAVAGQGTVEVDGASRTMVPGQAMLILKGRSRSIYSQPDGEFIYLTAHRRRQRLMPRPLGQRSNSAT